MSFVSIPSFQSVSVGNLKWNLFKLSGCNHNPGTLPSGSPSAPVVVLLKRNIFLQELEPLLHVYKNEAENLGFLSVNPKVLV